MVWAIVRRAPRRAYLEFEDQPAINVEYTLNLDTHRNRRILNGRKKEGFEQGYKDQRTRARNRPSIGAARNGYLFAKVGLFSSFVKSFNASANGWGIPAIPTLLGPFRIWK